MADIISGKSRFNGDRNAPVKKVISINREMAASTEDNEDVLDEAAVKRTEKRLLRQADPGMKVQDWGLRLRNNSWTGWVEVLN